MIAEILKDELSSTSVIQWACLQTFKEEYLAWDPTVLNEELLDIEPGTPEINLDKAQAAAYILRNNGVYIYWEIFEKIGRTLNMNDPLFQTVAPLTPAEICWAILEIDILDPNEDRQVYEAEVLGYIEQIFRQENILRTPTFLNHVYNFSEYDKHNKVIQGVHDEYEKEIRMFIENRLSRIEAEYETYWKKKLNVKKEFLSHVSFS